MIKSMQTSMKTSAVIPEAVRLASSTARIVDIDGCIDINTVMTYRGVQLSGAPGIEAFGTESQKRRFLPNFSSSKAVVALAFLEDSGD
jgi:hypothetical protein